MGVDLNSILKAKLLPIPDGKGIGFCLFAPVDGLEQAGYRLQVTGRFHNYNATPAAFRWPVIYPSPEPKVIDAFSPNVNKKLHVGHLRNLALAKSFRSLLPASRFVAMLGYSQGVADGAEAALQGWFDFVGYTPTVFKDTDLAKVDSDIQLQPGQDGQAGCLVWAGPKGNVILVRSDGRHTYAYHDLAFAAQVKPDHYLTGAEQREHFQSLGLESKHLPMGLVLDPKTGQKMKSRDGTAMSAEDALAIVVSRLDQTPEPKKLAWNVLAWNFLHVARTGNVLFNVEDWTKPDSPGMYISYTAARVLSALENAGWRPMVQPQLTEEDAALVGYSEYRHYWMHRAIELMDPAGLANYTHDLARYLGRVYHGEKLRDGREARLWAVHEAYSALCECMGWLGMFPLGSV